MSRLKAPAATATSAYMDVEPTHNGPAGNLDLELLINMVFVGLSATVGALLGQRHVDNLVGPLFGKRAMGLGAVVVARLAARLLGILLRRSLGERSGLAFLGPRGLLQELLQLRHSLLEFGDPPFEPGTIGTLCRCTCIASHATNIGKMAA
jgi:hypothetical protein